MPASIDTIHSSHVPALGRPVQTTISNTNNSPSVFNYGDEDVVLPNIDSYFNDFTFNVDDAVAVVDAAALFMAGLEFLKSLFHLNAATPPTKSA